MNISIIGTGYVGLVTGTCFAETGNRVTCVDIDEKKVAAMRSGHVPIFEPGLEVLFDRNTKNERLSFTTDIQSAVKSAEIIFLALPTPPGEDGAADLSYVLNVAQQLSEMIDRYTVVVDKSTVPVGTAEKVEAILSKKLDKSLFDVVSNPEFLREGVAVADFMKPDRVVIGTSSEKAKQLMEKLYRPFVLQGNPIYFMDERSAEMTKYAANSYLATRISFMNEIANLCEIVGADVDNVRKGMGSDGRIGKRFLFAGIGYGGSCFPKDVKALAKTAADNNYNFKILDSVMKVNALQKSILSNKILDFYGEKLSQKTIAIWGLSFKPNTDDIREAPALTIIDELLERGAKIRAFDPEGMENMKKVYGNRIHFVQSKYEATEGADCLAILTEWNEFRTPDFGELQLQLNDKLIFDGRNLFDINVLEETQLTYISMGRNKVNTKLIKKDQIL